MAINASLNAILVSLIYAVQHNRVYIHVILLMLSKASNEVGHARIHSAFASSFLERTKVTALRDVATEPLDVLAAHHVQHPDLIPAVRTDVICCMLVTVCLSEKQ